MRKVVCVAGLATLIASLSVAESVDERAARVHREAIVFDGHADTLLRAVDLGEDLGQRCARGEVDLPRMREGGVDVQVLAVFPATAFRTSGFLRRTLDILDSYQSFVKRYPHDVVPALTVEDIRAAASKGRVATLLSVEGGHAIENDLDVLSLLWQHGVRSVGLAWTTSPAWAGSSGDADSVRGLTSFGRSVVHEMNRLGMAVDLSHASDATFRDVLAVSTKPVIASHSSCRALAENPRNLSDEQLRALAARGGVVGINFYPGFLDAPFERDLRALQERLRSRLDDITAAQAGHPDRAWHARLGIIKQEARTLRRVTVSRLVNHIQHAAKVAGVDHVGIGSDFDGTDAEIAGLEDCSKLPALTAELLRRGFSETDVKKILGGNFLRVFGEIIGR